MPRGKSYRRSEAAKMRAARDTTVRVGHQRPSTEFRAQSGTGFRHRVNEWPISDLTGKSHRLVIPAEDPNKKFVLIVGASHLRSVVDGVVPMPEGCYSFGVMSTPGACADQLRTEAANAVVTRTPDAVCVMAPTNNLTASATIDQAGQAFRHYLATVCSRWPKVFVVDFVPRLTVPGDYQELMRQEFHRQSKLLGVKYFHLADKFPLKRLELWAPDGIHLSDNFGMPILVDILQRAASQYLETPAPVPPVFRQVFPKPSVRRKRKAVKEEVIAPRPPPSKRTLVESGRKKNHSGGSKHGSAPPKRRMVHHQADGTPVVLRECFIPLNPVRFSPSILAAMDKVFPSALGDVPTGKQTVPVELCRRPAVIKQRRARQQRPPARRTPVSVGVEPDAAVDKVEATSSQVSACDGEATPSQVSARDVPVSTCLEAVPMAVQVPEGGGLQRTQEATKGRRASDPSCVCSTDMPVPLVSGSTLQTVPSDAHTLIACSVVAAAKHIISPVCTWRASDVDQVSIEGKKLAAFVASKKQESGRKKELCKLVEEHSVFGRRWKAKIGKTVYRHFDVSEEEHEMREKLQEYLLRDGMCLLILNGSVSLLIQHKDYLAVVDCGIRNSQGLATESGTSVVVFNTCLNDLMLHIRNLKESLDAEDYAVTRITVEDSNVEDSEHQDSSSPSYLGSVRGSFHQGDDRFVYGGLQCGAVSLAALAKHTVDSVFTWQSETLDKVVVSGDELYTFLRESDQISCGEELLSVLDLPKERVIDGSEFEFEYGDCQTGEVDVVEGEFIDAGAHTTLRDGLERVCTKYETCIFTLSGSTSAIISQEGRYAVVDSHARSADGMVDEAGKSVVVYFSSLDQVCNHIHRFADAIKRARKSFEITGVHVIHRVPHSQSQEFSFDVGDDVQLVESELAFSFGEYTEQAMFASDSHRGKKSRDKKRRTSLRNTTSKKTMSMETDQENSDVEFVNDVQSTSLEFNLDSKEVADGFCKQLNIELEKVDAVPSEKKSMDKKRRRSLRNTTSKMTKWTDCDQDNSDVEFVNDVQGTSLEFNPVSKEVADAICKQLNIESEKVDAVPSAGGVLGAPCLTENIVGDGNCFFRAVSQAISGTQKNHRKIRLAVVKQLQSNPLTYESIIRSEYSSVSQYLSMSRMRFVGSWASEVEIKAAADFLGVNIFTYYNDRWLQYSSNDRRQSNQGLYIANSSGNHYETVVCVQQPQTQMCYGYCKVKDSISEGYNLRRQNGNDDASIAADSLKMKNLLEIEETCRLTTIKTQVGQNICASKGKYSFSRYLKCRRTSKDRLKYHVLYKDKVKLARKRMYQENLLHRTKKKAVNKTKYRNDVTHKDKLKQLSKMKYENVLHQEIKKEQSKMKYRVDVSYQEKKKEQSKRKYREDISHQEKVKEFSQKKYREDISHQEKKKELSKRKYREDVSHQEKKKELSKRKYREDVSHQEKVKEFSEKKYREDISHQEKKKELSKRKYREDVSHQEKVKEFSEKKYREDISHQEKKKEQSKRKYREDLAHKEKVKQFSKRTCINVSYKEKNREQSKFNYKRNQLHRNAKKVMSKRKYHSTPQFKTQVKESVNLKRHRIKVKLQDFDFVMKEFLEKVKDGPDFVCSCCNRLLFKHQVLNCKLDYYKKSELIAKMAEECISEEYLHKCNTDCVLLCPLVETAQGKLWICHTCHYKLSKGQMPPECATNNLRPHSIPPELSCLNSLEQHLIALHIPFMKMLALPRGGQNGCHGPVTCVPASISETINLLPRSNMEGSLLPVKLKRKLTYKGHYEYQFVDRMKIIEALRYLKRSNIHYKDVEFNEDWINEFCREDVVSLSTQSDEACDDGEDELLHDRQQHCMFQDTCLMPVDIGQEALDQYFDKTLNVAPGEGNNPVKLLTDHSNEAKCFPVLFPFGSNAYHEFRPYRLTLSRYFNNRLLHADGRFSQNVEYIFFALYLSELEQVVSNVSIALRKGQNCTSQKLGDLLKNEESLKKMLEFDDGYRFLKPIRGTPAFWQSAQRDLLAYVRQLGVPTWFCSFSSADMRWTNLLNSILKREGRSQTLEQLEWAERCELLRKNPVTAARMFDFRWHCFLRQVLMSPSHPIGEITDYYYRVEFQQRGSPHIHVLFWVKNAPIIDKNSDKEVTLFIDKYVTCELPPQDDPLFEVVTSVQQHSKRHSKTCKKKKTVCRFNFPRPASCRTFICRGKNLQDDTKICKCHVDKIDEPSKCTCGENDKSKKDTMTIEAASEILAQVKKAIADEDSNYGSIEELFKSLRLSQKTFEAAYNRCGRSTHIVLKRQLDSVWINQYSKPLLNAYNANIDIQFCVDSYAVVVYIISYMSKSEREMGLLLGNAQREASKDGNVSAKEALKRLGSTYLHNRDVSAQEAVYRLTNMHLKEGSRKVVFVPTGENVVKMSLPLSVLRQRASSQDLSTEDMWMTSLVDRYKNRPNHDPFNDMCLAKFASEYRILSKSEKSSKAVQLQHGFGFITKRTRTQPAVIRYARFSKTKDAEKYYRSVMQLFLPYRLDHELKSSTCQTFEQFYQTGFVVLKDGSRHSVKSIIDENRTMFETETDNLEDIRDEIDTNGTLEDAWCELCPEQELERLESLEELKQMEKMVDDPDANIPDLSVTNEQVSRFDKRHNILNRNDGLALIRSLNEKQLSVFYQVRKWCLDRVNGKNPEPLHLFITGGAGTGKSHLIKAIQYEAFRLLSPTCRHPDGMCVLLTAPTGIAAYNLQATTIHTTFSIGKDVRLPYTPLGEEKLNSLRVLYSDLQLLIIDEISMVNINLLSYIHGRLRQIKQTGDFSPFGNISVVAVGDFFQLPPVRGKPLYVDDIRSNLWGNLFKVVELTQIVRQQDEVFASLLNRIRTRSKGAALSRSDVNILKSCETGEVSSALHIFATNQQVNEHNIKQLMESCPEYDAVHAQDFVNDKKTGNLKLLDGHHAKAPNTCLPEVLNIGEGARVMLCKNVDVADGLVNGVCGIVARIITFEKSNYPKKIFVKFDDERVGAKRRKRYRSSSLDLADTTGIEPEEERATNKGGLRRQFPLKLAWACTVHKVQGITVDRAVVSLNKIFSAGQAYVALSRVRSLSGLIIQDFEEKRIYCKDDVKDAIGNMAPFLGEGISRQIFNKCTFSVFMMNVQSLARHSLDLASCTQQLQLNCIAVTETWLPAAASLETVKIAGYSFYNCPRSSSYSSSHPALRALQDQQHGGVGIYCADSETCNILNVPHVNLECLVYEIVSHDIVVAVVYRPPSYPVSLFKEHIGRLLDWLEPLSNTVAVMGDFNDDIMKSSTISQCITKRGYTQLVKEPTTERGTLIDHVYIKTSLYEVEATVVPMYFSDHEGVVCTFK